MTATAHATEGSIEIEFGGARLTLLRERAAWRQATRTMFAADLHIGKAAAFRAWGAPVPEEVTRRDLERLLRLIEDLRPQRVVILGDLLHAPAGMTDETVSALQRWREAIGALPVLLVRGNHDRSAAEIAELGVSAVGAPFDLDGWRLLHDPAQHDGATPALAGHLHPGVVLRPADGGKGAGLRSACFWERAAAGAGRRGTAPLLVLPAFGTFTGLLPIRAAEGDRVYAVGPDSVVQAPAPPVRTRHRRRSATPAGS